MSMQQKKSTRIILGFKQWFCLLLLTCCFSYASYGQCSMSCDDEIQVSLNQECEAEITYRMILRDPDNPYVCNPNGPSAYKVQVMDEDGVTIPTSPVITCEYVGRTLLVKVKHWYSGNSCWSKVIVEDKIAPVMSNCAPLELWCNQSAIPESEGGDAPVPSMVDACAESCQTMSLIYEDTDTTIYTCEDAAFQNGIVAQLTRTWTACDNIGNCRSCVQPITIRIPSFEDIYFPPSLTGENALECGGCDPTDLSCTGSPSLHHQNLENTLCHLEIDYMDATTKTECAGSYTIERKWTIRNTCTGETHAYTQYIEIVDKTPPVIICTNNPPAVMHNHAPEACSAEVMIPAADISDDCSEIENIEVITKVYKLDSIGKRWFMEKVDGANGGFKMELEYGKYEVYYQATDDCGNVSNNVGAACMFEIKDDIAPTPVCNALTKLTLDKNGKGLIYAKSFDNGSYDNCCLETYEVRRNSSEEYMLYVEFSCEDTRSTEPNLVQLRLTDCYGNSSTCMIEVIIDDNEPPTILSCADDILVSCGAGLSLDQIKDSLLTAPIAEDDCIGGITSQVYLKQDYRNECGVGAAIFEWEVFDAAGNGPATCEQLVSFIDDTPISISFPPDYTYTECIASLNELPPSKTGVPVITGMDCETVEVLHTDGPIEGNISCGTFIRTWRVTNLCEENSTVAHEQLIRTEDVEAPAIECNGEFFDICLDGDACKRSIEVPGVIVIDCSEAVSVRAEWTFTPHEVCTGEVQTGIVEEAGNGFMSPEFGPGQLWINFYATDACGNESVCNRDYTFKDCQAPEVICLPGITLNLDATGIVEVWANDFHQEIIDNCEECPDWDYQFSFSQDTTEDVRFYGCSELGVKSTQIWVTDPYGNQNFCPVTFVIKGAGVCDSLGVDTTATPAPDPSGMASVGGIIYMEDGQPVEAVEVSAENHLAERMDQSMTDESGAYAFEFQRNSNVKINPYKNDDATNGVTTYDILELRRHILGFRDLNSPYKIIAADVNHSNSVTTADIVALRRIILELDEEFVNNTSWRFIKADYQFTDPTNPFVDEMPEYAMIPDLTQAMEIDFVAIKVGDLSGNAIGHSGIGARVESRNNQLINLEIGERQIEKNRMEDIQISLPTKEIEALQFTLNFDPRVVNIIEIPTNNLVNEVNFGTRFKEKGALTFSWEKAPTNTNELLTITLKVSTNKSTAVSELFTINSTITPAEAYDALGTVYPVGLAISDDKYDYALFQNQPNPFRQATNIRFSLPAKSQGKLTILDITGRTLKTFEQTFEKGINELNISNLSSKGVLYYQLETAFGTKIQKMLRVE